MFGIFWWMVVVIFGIGLDGHITVLADEPIVVCGCSMDYQKLIAGLVSINPWISFN